MEIGANNKILHLSEGKLGGAGISAYRFHRSLLEFNYNSSYFDLLEMQFESNNIVSEVSLPAQRGFDKYLDKIFHIINRMFKFKNLRKKYKFEVVTHSIFNSWSLNSLLLDFCKDYDTIVFHWTAKKINYNTIKKLSQIKCVFVYCHDEKYNHGLFHYSGDKKKTFGFLKVIDSFLFTLSMIYQWDRKVIFLSPSIWLTKKTLVANKNRAVYYLPYSFQSKFTIPSVDFKKGNKPVELLFVCQSLSNYRKGFWIIKELLPFLINETDIVIHVVGEYETDELIFDNIIYHGFINHEDLFSLFSRVDVFLLPSIEDNMPNVMLEALCFGCLVVAFNVGGMSEVIKNGFNGFFASQIDPINYLEAIKKSISFSRNINLDRKALADFHRFLFSSYNQVETFNNVYNNFTHNLL